MKRTITPLVVLCVALWGTNAVAQHGHGKPATGGLEHAEATANPHGNRGIENAETKQAEHKKDKKKHKAHKHSVSEQKASKGKK